MCEDITCIRKSHEGCEREIWRKMFALDDGYSWVEVGKKGKGKKGAMFMVDDETECMRRQSKEEMRVSEWNLGREKGRFLEYDEKVDYMSLVRYFQKEKVEVKKGETYLERIERESAERAKLELERLEEEKLEKEWAEKMILMDKKFITKLVKAWKVEVREAKNAEMEVGEIVEIEG